MQSGESDEDKRERLRQRVAAERERKRAAQMTANDLSTDIGSVYGRQGPSIFSLIGVPGTTKSAAGKASSSNYNAR